MVLSEVNASIEIVEGTKSDHNSSINEEQLKTTVWKQLKPVGGQPRDVSNDVEPEDFEEIRRQIFEYGPTSK
jgi:hypothetical protein